MNRVFDAWRKIDVTVIEEFAPVTLISRAIGVFPLRVNRVGGKKTFAASPVALSYSIVLLILTFVHLLHVPSMALETNELIVDMEMDRNYSGKDSQPHMGQNKFIRVMNPIAVSSMAIMSRINALWHIRRDLPEVFVTIDKIDSSLRSERNRSRKNFRTIWVFVGLNFLVCSPSQFLSVCDVYFSKSRTIGLSVFMNSFNNFTSVSAEFQFLAICFLLTTRFEAINQKLAKLFNKYEVEDTWPRKDQVVSTLPIVPILNTDFLQGYRKDHPDRKNYRSITNRNATTIDDARSSNVIEILRQSHQRLCDVLDTVSCMFQVQLLFSLGGCFLNNLFNLYFFLTINGGSMFFSEATNETKMAFLISGLKYAWLGIYYAIRFSAMAAVASKTTKTAKQAVVYVSSIRRNRLDSATKDELILFFDHVTSREIQFSAAGLFDLNVPLIASAVATGSTFLVIMAQFPKS